MPTRTVTALVVTTALLASGCAAQSGIDAAASPAAPPAVAPDAPGVAEAGPYIGLAESAALELAQENGDDVRVGTVDDLPTDSSEFEIGRVTLIVEDGVVATAYVETERGVVEVAAQ